MILTDAPEMLEWRKTHFEKHVAYLTSRPEIFLDGGSLAEAEDSDPTGGIWIVRATDRDAIVRLIEGDPICSPELRSYKIFATGKRFNISEPG